MTRWIKVCGWALVVSVAGLSAAGAEPPKQQENTFGERGDEGDEEMEGLGGIDVASTPSIADKPSKEEAEKKTDRFIQGAFCMITFILFTAGYVGTKSYKGHRVQEGV